MPKILLVHFQWDGFVVMIMEYIVEALRSMGTEVRVQFAGNKDDLLQANKDFQPALNIFYHPPMDLDQYQEVITKMGGHKLAWCMECPYEIDTLLTNAGLFGYIFVHDKSSADFLRYRLTRHCRVSHVPHACLPSAHHPRPFSYEHRSDLLFVGNAFKSRVKFLEEQAAFLSDYMFTLVGIGYPLLPAMSGQRLLNTHVWRDDYYRYVSGARIALNLHRMNSDLDMRNLQNVKASSPNNRLFEIAATGVPQLVDVSRRPELDEYFEPEREIMTFASPEEFREKFRWMMEHPSEARAIGEASMRRALAHHTYQHRLQAHLLHVLE
jgi:spore maturation protein CgeB